MLLGKASMQPIIYLDTQDFSRFGDVIRGKANKDDERLFLEIEKFSINGDAIFPVSMPIMSELLQYDPHFKDTVVAKAEAVERICGHWALAYPSRLILNEIMESAEQFGTNVSYRTKSLLSAEREWFPDVGGTLDNFKEEIRSSVETSIDSKIIGRKARRKANSLLRKIDRSKQAEKLVPAFSAEQGIPAEALTKSIVMLLRNKISPDEASRQLFIGIARPTTFVKTYFMNDKFTIDRSILPIWMRLFGENLQKSLTDLQGNLISLTKSKDFHFLMDNLLNEMPQTIGRGLFALIQQNSQSNLIDENNFEQLINSRGFAQSVPSMHITGRAIAEYIRQITGAKGTIASIERSFGGDLVHSFYLPYVNFWRGDRRFCSILKAAVPGSGPIKLLARASMH